MDQTVIRPFSPEVKPDGWTPSEVMGLARLVRRHGAASILRQVGAILLDLATSHPSVGKDGHQCDAECFTAPHPMPRREIPYEAPTASLRWPPGSSR